MRLSPWQGGCRKEKNGCSKLHLMSYICNAGTSLSVQPCAQAPVRSVCDSAFLHATAPQDMAICHWLGLLINTPPTSHDSAHIHTYLHTILLTDGWKGGPRHVWSEQRVKEDGGMCGGGGLLVTMGETDCKARQEKRFRNTSINQNKPVVQTGDIFRQLAYINSNSRKPAIYWSPHHGFYPFCCKIYKCILITSPHNLVIYKGLAQVCFQSHVQIFK